MALSHLINGAANLHRDTNFGGEKFIIFLWSFWWLDVVLSFTSCFVMTYFMSVSHFLR